MSLVTVKIPSEWLSALQAMPPFRWGDLVDVSPERPSGRPRDMVRATIRLPESVLLSLESLRRHDPQRQAPSKSDMARGLAYAAHVRMTSGRGSGGGRN